MPSNAQNAQGTTLEISSGSGGAESCSAIALGFPTILTSNAHALVNGDVVTCAAFEGADAASINSLTFVVSNVTTNTFAIGLDSSALTITVGSGTATPVAWTTVGEIVSGGGFDGTSAIIPKTNLASTAVEKDIGLQDFGTLKLEIQIYDSDAGQTAMRLAKANQTSKSFKVTYPDDTTRTFDGFVMSFSESFGVDSIVTGSTEILIDGEVTYA